MHSEATTGNSQQPKLHPVLQAAAAHAAAPAGPSQGSDTTGSPAAVSADPTIPSLAEPCLSPGPGSKPLTPPGSPLARAAAAGMTITTMLQRLGGLVAEPASPGAAAGDALLPTIDLLSMADPTSAPLLVPPHLIMPPYNSATATASASAARRSASPSFPAPPGAQSKSSGGYNTPAGPYVDGYHAGPASGNLSSTGSVSGGPSAGTAAASSGFPDPAMLAALAGFSAAVRANSPKAAPLPGGTPSGSGNANGGGGSGGNSGRVSPMGGSLLLGGLSRALGSPGSSMGPTLTGSNGGAQASIGSAAVDASGSAGGGTSQMGMAAGGMAAAAGAGVYPPFAGYAGYTSGYNSQGLGQLLYRHTPAAERQGAAPPDYLHRTPSHSRALHAPKPQGGHAVPGLLQAVDNSSQPAVLPVYGFGGGDEGTGPLEGAFGSYVCSGIPSALNVAPGSAAASSGDRGSDDTEMQDVGMAAGASESAGAAGTARPTPMPSAPSPPFSPTARNAQSGRMSPAGSAGAGGGAGGLQCVGSRGSSPGLPAAPLPPAVCLATAQRFIATVLRGVREGLSLEVEEEIQAVLSKDIVVQVGVVTGPRRGLANFTRAIALDADVYRDWRMDILAMAAPPCGGCAFVWVLEQATNIKSVMGLPPTNKTSRSHTLHLVEVGGSGRVTRVWTRYQMFAEIRSLLLKEPSQVQLPDWSQRPFMQRLATNAPLSGAVSDLDMQARRSVSAWLGMVDSSCAGVWSSYSRLSEDLAVWEAMGAWRYLNPGARSSHPAHHHTGGLTAAVQASLQGGTDAAGMTLEGAESGNGGGGSTGVHGRDAVRASLNELHADYDIRVREPLVALDTSLGVGFSRWAADVTSRTSGHCVPLMVLEVYGFTAMGALEDVVMYRPPLDGEMHLLKGLPGHVDVGVE